MEGFEVKPIPKQLTHEWLLEKHYAKKIPMILFSFGLYDDRKVIGVNTWGLGGNFQLNNLIDGYGTLELNRLVVNDGLPKNTLSWFLSQSIKMLPRPKVLISYADPNQGHQGYIYQATNWLYTGRGSTTKQYRQKDTGKMYHSKSIWDLLGPKTDEELVKMGFEIYKFDGKHRYIKFIGSKKEQKDMLDKLPFQIEPYPKGENRRYDASYQPSTPISLF